MFDVEGTRALEMDHYGKAQSLSGVAHHIEWYHLQLCLALAEIERYQGEAYQRAIEGGKELDYTGYSEK